ncbi:MAG: indole-3-glycerol-phosphate synthase [Oligosphaeraceae bacterium]
MSGDILKTIVERNLPLLEERKAKLPRTLLEKQAAAAPAPPSFLQAFLPAATPRVISELKAASPSRGVIREPLEVPALARELEEAGAAALSVLTEPLFFHGSLENLQRAAAACRLPLLRKDFLHDPYQLLEAKAAGASAVLLIAAMLEPDRFRMLCQEARALGLQVLGEAHTPEELEVAAQADLLGVNARDLKTFHTSLETSARLLRLAAERYPGKPLIAESAVATRADMEMLASAGARGFLIGETLMRAPSPGSKLKELLA